MERNPLVPVRRRIELDLDRLFGLFDVIPFAKRVPARRNHLYEDFSLGNGRYFHRAILVRLQVEFGKLLVMMDERPALLVKADIDAGIANRLPFIVKHAEAELRHGRASGFVVLFRNRTRTGAIFSRRSLDRRETPARAQRRCRRKRCRTTKYATRPQPLLVGAHLGTLLLQFEKPLNMNIKRVG